MFVHNAIGVLNVENISLVRKEDKLHDCYYSIRVKLQNQAIVYDIHYLTINERNIDFENLKKVTELMQD